MEKSIELLQQWVLENQEERGVLVLATGEEKNYCCLIGTTYTIAKAMSVRAEKNPEIRRVLSMGLLAASKSQRFLSLRARLISWLLK